MRRIPKSENGFTLIELLVVVAVIACLASLLMPTLAKVRQNSDSLKCVSNLKQIGSSANLYATEHSERLPVIEPWPADPVYPSGSGALSILQALGPYGVSTAVLQCPSDLKGPDFYPKEGSSYQWYPMAYGQNSQGIETVYMDRQSQVLVSGTTEQVPMSQLYLMFDYSAVHGGGYNVLFGDGHVTSGNIVNSIRPPGS
jgi:prepilin-type N-terminal cleavage/methylation domain-containing protein/prepilin-type processing-associated H-X9-DG protein